MPRTPKQPPIYANAGSYGHRKYLYEQEESPVVTIQVDPETDPQTRVALVAAIERINSLRNNLSVRSCGSHDLLPQQNAAISAITCIYAISPRIPAQIFPLPGGGLQVEWHHGPLDIEIECLADTSIYAYLALNETIFIDEQASGRRAVEILERIRKELDNATVGQGAGASTFDR
jgi:hypothetical protein